MSGLDEIIAHGNRGGQPHRRGDNWVICADGFHLSVIAGGGSYSSPRVAISADLFMPGYDDVDASYSGPFSAVEVGFPSQRPEPWHCSEWTEGYDRHEDHAVCDGWETFGDGSDDEPSVYGYVPVRMVRALVALHGGEVALAAKAPEHAQ